MGDLLKSLIESVIGDLLKSGFLKIKDNMEFKNFIKEIEEWSNEFIRNNDSTIVAGSDFYRSMEHYHIINNLIEFIVRPTNEQETVFIERMITTAIKNCEKEKSLTVDDKRAIKELISEILNRVKAFFDSKVSIENAALLYESKKVSGKVDAIAEGVNQLLESQSKPKPISNPKQFKLPENTIIRKFSKYDKLQSSYWFSIESKNMIDICEKEKHIVILGEAGCGKTIALKQLAVLAYESNYYVILHSLKNYTNETIEEIIAYDYPHLESGKLFLIFDAYDEIEEKNQKDFARRLSAYSQHNQNVIIAVSSRNNFYSFADDEGCGGTLDKFAEYGITPICTSEINNYLSENEVSIEDFYKAINEKSLSSLVSVPFYLAELVRIFKEKVGLPPKSSVMESIIESRFKKDKNKYVNTENLEENRDEIFYCLEKLAFALQCMNLIEISNTDYQRLTKNHISKPLIKYSGVFSKDVNGKFAFEHNNFREYLTARYINKMDIESIQKLICNNEGKIHNSWVNVLSYLIIIRDSDDLKNLLIENNAEIVVKFEINRVEAGLRTGIVKNILESFAQKNIWLSYGLNTSYELAKFGQSNELCDYLIERIEQSEEFREQSNAISVLGEFSVHLAQNEKVKETLFDFIKSDTARNQEKAAAIDAISQLQLQSDEITVFIVTELFNTDDCYLVKSIVKYLNKLKLYDKYIDIYVEAYSDSLKHRNDRYGMLYELIEGFEKVETADALCKVIKAISKNHISSSLESKHYDAIINNAIKLYDYENKEIFNTIVDTLVEVEVYNHALSNACLNFFKQTDTIFQLFVDLTDKFLEKDNYIILAIIEKIADENCYLYILDEYYKTPQKYEYILKCFAYNLKNDDENRVNIKKALYNNGIVIEERKHYIDYEKARINGRQILFDSLFSKERYCKLVEMLLNTIGNINATFGELNEKYKYPSEAVDTESYAQKYALLELYYSLQYFDDNLKVLDEIKSFKSWQDYLISQAYHMLNSDREIGVNPEQKEFFLSYCNEKISLIDFLKEIKDEGDGLSYSNRIVYVVFFSEYFDIYYDKDIFRKMTVVPGFLWNYKEYRYDKPFSKYITDHLSQEELSQQVRINLVNGGLCKDALEAHIIFCKLKHLDFAENAAVSVCLDTASKEHIKREAIGYLLELYGLDYIYENFLDTVDKKLLKVITDTTVKLKDDRLKYRLEKLFDTSDEGKVYLNYLIMLDSLKALEYYYEIALSKMKSTEITDDDSIDNTLALITEMSNPELLDCIDKLRILVHTKDFKDVEHFGLHNSVYNVYKRIALTDYEEVTNHIKTALENPNISSEDKAFCNSILIDIECVHNNMHNKAWSIKDIKDFWEFYDEHWYE